MTVAEFNALSKKDKVRFEKVVDLFDMLGKEIIVFRPDEDREFFIPTLKALHYLKHMR